MDFFKQPPNPLAASQAPDQVPEGVLRMSFKVKDFQAQSHTLLHYQKKLEQSSATLGPPKWLNAIHSPDKEAVF
jgi:hypothetical protein